MTIIQTDKPLKPRAEHDFYETPIELCRAALNLLDLKDKYMKVLDPGCGNGVWGKALREISDKDHSMIVGIDIREEANPDFYDRIFTGNYLEYFSSYKVQNLDFGFYPKLVMGNPPFKYAEEFVRHSIENNLQSWGDLLFLLPLSFLESTKRGRGLFKEFPVKEVYVSMRRVSFWGDGKSDNTAYAIYHWVKGWSGETTLKWLDWNYDPRRTD